MIPEKIERYEIRHELGRGGMATVYHAYDPRFERDVAIKVLPRVFMHDPTFRARFEQEAKTIAALDHPAIVPVYDVGEQDGQPYLVMRHIDGGSLADRIQEGPLPLDESAHIIERVGEALSEAHRQGVIHRDIKPGNILFDTRGYVYLSDFGIVKLSESTAHLTGSGIVGTPAYTAPEVSQPGGVSPLIDVYALGVTLYQMLTGQLPYESDTPLGMLMAHATHPVPSVRHLRPDLPEDIDVVIAHVLAKDPASRYQSPGELAAALQLVARGEPLPPGHAPYDTIPLPQQQGVPTPAPGLPITEPMPQPPGMGAVPAPAVAAPSRRRRGVPGWAYAVGGLIALCALAGLVAGAAIVLPMLGSATEEPYVPPTRTRSPTVIPPGEEEKSLPTETPPPTRVEATPEEKPEPTDRPTPTEEPETLPASISGGDGAPMVLVPAGEFTMGSTLSQIEEATAACMAAEASGCRFDNEAPQREVWLDDFYIHVYEVTENQYHGSGGDYPVVNVSWNDARNYCERYGMRLPTEEEWEKAARGVDGRIYPWGNTFDSSRLNSEHNGREQRSSVDSYSNGQSPYGVYNMAGNVWEWTGSKIGGDYVVRGGSFTNGWWFVRAANRGQKPPGDPSEYTGFRCVQNAP